MDRSSLTPADAWLSTPQPWPYYQTKSVEELKQSLMSAVLELESTRMAAREELRRGEEERKRLALLLKAAWVERDEAKEKCLQLRQTLLQSTIKENMGLHNLAGFSDISPQNSAGKSHKAGDSNSNTTDCESITFVSSSPNQSIFHDLDDPLESDAPLPESSKVSPESGAQQLPEKGKLLEAVMKAGPLLQTLMLAGPLPQWRHPPPPLDSFDIPPVGVGIGIPNNNSSPSSMAMAKKRPLSSYCDYSMAQAHASKHQRLA
ncbi:hypothetical protein AMTRI_Chr07g78050 [Amborella trichopoda]|uniref:uncharacterized protein LOC105420025 n=1 Tax=Amborella trichopoda TaxID=13333 RepID=UPI0005D2DA6D|nr:uncharacterized protein LOC105420025 [Amborella trichopoda]|eukprot:XP_011620365.1 uncharacterized protein LOC105420025 [Amborella trichopoda]